MNTARIVVLAIAIGAGGIAAYLASGSDKEAPAPAAVVEQIPTMDVLVAKDDIGVAVPPAPMPGRLLIAKTPGIVVSSQLQTRSAPGRSGEGLFAK